MTAILKVDEIQDTSGNNIINENAGTVTIGKAGNTTNIVGTLQNDGSGLVSGITEADLWRVPSSFTGAASPISNWERADDATSGYLGTGMTESSGTFTFPSTGIWRVSFTHSIYVNADERNAATTIRVSSNSGSSYDGVAETHLFGQQTSSNLTHNLGTSTAIIDVTDASTFRVNFYTNPQNSNTSTFGQSDANQTFAEFIRLGDT